MFKLVIISLILHLILFKVLVVECFNRGMIKTGIFFSIGLSAGIIIVFLINRRKNE